MRSFTSLLEAKWGKLEPSDHCLQNGRMPFVSDQARLNLLFVPENTAALVDRAERQFGSKLPEQLIAFYRRFNGCRLFFSSLNIFGVQIHPADFYQPFDLFVENDHIYGTLNKKERNACDMVFFASIGGDYAFGFKPDDNQTIIGTKKGSLAPVQTFDCFDAFFEFHFARLIDEYDVDCRKMHPDTRYKGIPVLEHQTNDII